MWLNSDFFSVHAVLTHKNASATMFYAQSEMSKDVNLVYNFMRIWNKLKQQNEKKIANVDLKNFKKKEDSTIR